MKKLIYVFTLILFFAYHAEAQNIDVILIGGQSNATGVAYVANIPNQFQINKQVLFYYSRYLKGGEGAETWQPLSPVSEGNKTFGVELSLGTTLQKKYPSKKIALIKHALSGSNLYQQWNPGNRDNEKQGEEYTKFVKTVCTGLEALRKNGYIPTIKAMVWQQGEGDARDIAGIENSKSYGYNLKNFILQIRADLGYKNMLFIYGRVMPLPADRFTGREEVREAQYLVSEASGSDLSVPNAILVE